MIRRERGESDVLAKALMIVVALTVSSAMVVASCELSLMPVLTPAGPGTHR
jgi:hypothetical protein